MVSIPIVVVLNTDPNNVKGVISYVNVDDEDNPFFVEQGAYLSLG